MRAGKYIISICIPCPLKYDPLGINMSGYWANLKVTAVLTDHSFGSIAGIDLPQLWLNRNPDSATSMANIGSTLDRHLRRWSNIEQMLSYFCEAGIEWWTHTRVVKIPIADQVNCSVHHQHTDRQNIYVHVYVWALHRMLIILSGFDKLFITLWKYNYFIITNQFQSTMNVKTYKVLVGSQWYLFFSL